MKTLIIAIAALAVSSCGEPRTVSNIEDKVAGSTAVRVADVPAKSLYKVCDNGRIIYANGYDGGIVVIENAPECKGK